MLHSNLGWNAVHCRPKVLKQCSGIPSQVIAGPEFNGGQLSWFGGQSSRGGPLYHSAVVFSLLQAVCIVWGYQIFETFDVSVHSDCS